MNKEFFGVFGGVDEFRRFRSPAAFDRVVEGETATVGVRDVGLGIPGRTAVYEGDHGVCVIWGEVYPPDGVHANAARWLLDRYAECGVEALGELNGSYLAFVDYDGTSFVATDPARTWECFYTDDPGFRVFGTDPVSVVRTMRSRQIDPEPLLEFVQLSVVLGDRTVLDGLRRVPFDGLLTRSETRGLDRFVYDPREFDYVDELARRLTRAIQRRADLPGRKGLLLSGGYDSRTILAGLPEIDECYTVGVPVGGEAEVARKVAAQYGADHRTLTVNGRYLNTSPEVIQYGLGIKESLHIHHAGYNDEIGVDTIYHGLLSDTFLRGYFLPRDGIELFGYNYPRDRLDPDPDVAHSLSKSFGYVPTCERVFPQGVTDAESSADFVRDVVHRELDAWSDRYDSIYNGIELFGVQNQPTVPFRTHLADHYIESFVAADAELIDWHLTTPPEHRNTRTLLKAIRKIDPDILRHRPPDRPHDSFKLNQIEKFLRRKLPVVDPFDQPWPDREELYERNQVDRQLFPDDPDVYDLPVRLKLRINDAMSWLDLATETSDVRPSDVLCPQAAL